MEARREIWIRNRCGSPSRWQLGTEILVERGCSGRPGTDPWDTSSFKGEAEKRKEPKKLRKGSFGRRRKARTECSREGQQTKRQLLDWAAGEYCGQMVEE